MDALQALRNLLLRFAANSERRDLFPNVNEQGEVYGYVDACKVIDGSDKNMHPVARVIVVCGEKIFLSVRRCNDMCADGLLDTPFTDYIRLWESLDDGCKRMLSGIALKNEPKFAIKHHYLTDRHNMLVYLYVAYIDDETLMTEQERAGGKFLSVQQADEMLSKQQFSPLFEHEYPTIKDIIDIREKYKES